MDAEAEQAALIGEASAALVPVHLDSQVLFQPLRHALQDALGSSPAPRVDGDVIRVAHKGEPARFQLLVEPIKVDVRQERAEWPACGVPLVRATAGAPARAIPARRKLR